VANTPTASAGPLSSPLMLPRPLLSHLQRPRDAGDEEDEAGDAPGSHAWHRRLAAAPAQHDSWVALESWEQEDDWPLSALFEEQLVYSQDMAGMRRGSLPTLSERHAVPVRLFGDKPPSSV